MKRFISIILMIVTISAAFAYEPTEDIIKNDFKNSFVISNPNKKFTNNKFYNRVKISKDFTLEDFIDKEWHSLVYHRKSCRYEWPSEALNDLMFITKDNWDTITKQELYDLTFDFFKNNTKLYKDAERKIVFEKENELSENELKLIDTFDKFNNNDRTLEETTDMITDMNEIADSIVNEQCTN